MVNKGTVWCLAPFKSNKETHTMAAENLKLLDATETFERIVVFGQTASRTLPMNVGMREVRRDIFFR